MNFLTSYISTYNQSNISYWLPYVKTLKDHKLKGPLIEILQVKTQKPLLTLSFLVVAST